MARAKAGLVLGTPSPPAHLRPLKQPLYDTMQYAAAGQLQIRMFSVPLGQVGWGVVLDAQYLPAGIPHGAEIGGAPGVEDGATDQHQHDQRGQ